jgi:hypothetical protein
MKEKLLTLVLIVLACGGTAWSQGPLLPKTVTGVNASTNVIVNVTLDPAFILKGTISGHPGSVPTSIAAVSTSPAATFQGTIDASTQTYRVVLPAGTYKLNVSFTNNSTTFSYTDSTAPSPFTVSGDMIRNIALPSVTTNAITGTVSNLNASFTSRSLSFDSTSISGFSDVNATPVALDPTGNYTVNLPSGTFTVQLSQSMSSFTPPMTFSTSSLATNFGSHAVTNPLNLAAPTINTATLSGTVTLTGGGAIPSTASLSVSDTTGPPTPQTTGSGTELLPSGGGYSFTLATGDTYTFTPFFGVPILPPPAPQAIFLPPAVPLPSALTMNTNFNPNFPALPGPATPVTISGRVTITGTNTPVAKASVTVGGNQITGDANTTFGRATTTDAFGNYSVVVAAGTNYTVIVSGQFTTLGDFDADGKADISVFRPSTGQWFIIPSSNPGNSIIQSWGLAGDIPVPGDYDGDGITDFAVWRPSTGQWFIIPSSNPGSPITQSFGLNGDIPVPGDYDGDGITDFAVWRPSTGQWFIIPSSNPGSPITQSFGLNGDIPVPGDYDGDGKTDFAVWRPSVGGWYILSSSTGNPLPTVFWGLSGDLPVPGDYDGDGKTDIAVWRPSVGGWYIISSSTGNPLPTAYLGLSGDIPVPRDYDRDRKTDLAVWRPTTGQWFIIPSATPNSPTVTSWGLSGDIPVQKPTGQ